MSVTQLAVIYVVVGSGWAVFRLSRSGLSGASLVDASLLLIIWPLYGPLMGGTDATPHNPLLIVLLEALPDAESARSMAHTITALDTRIEALDTLLAKPDFDPQVAAERAEALSVAGHEAAARAATRRQVGLLRLVETRARCVAQRVALDELLVHLRTQVEVARFTGTSDGANQAVEALESVVGDLDALLDDEVLRLG